VTTLASPAEHAFAVSHRLRRADAGGPISIARWGPLQAQLQILAVALIALALTIFLQTLSVTVHSLSGHAMADTATGLIGALASFIFAERTRTTHQLRDLLIAITLGILGVTDLVLAAGPTLIDANPNNSWKWILLAGRLVAGGILLGAAFCPAVDLSRSPRLPRKILLATAAGLTAIVAVVLLWRAQLPSLIGGGSMSSGLSGYGASPGHPLLSYLQLAGTALAGCAVFGLAQHAARTGDNLERSIAAGVAVLAIARLNYFLVSSPSSSRLYAGDILKLGAYLLILYGCLLEFRASQRRLVQRVAVDERRRMARDMHDGLAQELAFIATHSQRLNHTGEDAATVAHLQAAAERALHDSRTTIATLISPDEAPLDQLVARTVDSFRSRFGIAVELDLAPGVVVDAEQRNALLRILHEAMINAIRHGSARRVLVCLTDGGGSPSLKITDDGSGFDVQAAVGAGKGLGLTSMHERAQMLGGSLSIASRLGAGTVVEVELP
jgi:signal transduction histidine kinase